MKISMLKDGRYAIHTGNSTYLEVLTDIEALDAIDVEKVAQAETIEEVREKVQEVLYYKDRKYKAKKIISVLIDGVFTRKRSKHCTLSRRGQSYNMRLSRMLYNLERARALSIEVHLRNRIKKENVYDSNEGNLLGL